VRKSKKFRREPGGWPWTEVIVDPGDVDRGMDAYEAVYAKSWKQPEPYPAFVREWARICANEGWLRLGLAWDGDVPVAAQFWFVSNGTAYIFKLAYDEGHANLSAGTVLTAQLMRHVLEQDQVGEVDYLTGDDGYKRSWMSHRRERVGLLCCNRSTLPGLLLSAREWLGEVRQGLRDRRATPLREPVPDGDGP
jgi:hypothetical protein